VGERETDFVVHSVPGSPFGRSALIALEEKRGAISSCSAGAGRGEDCGPSGAPSVRRSPPWLRL